MQPLQPAPDYREPMAQSQPNISNKNFGGYDPMAGFDLIVDYIGGLSTREGY